MGWLYPPAGSHSAPCDPAWLRAAAARNRHTTATIPKAPRVPRFDPSFTFISLPCTGVASTKESLLPGTEVVVDGYQAKDGSHRCNGRDLKLPDGRTLFLGSSGTGAPYESQDDSQKK